MSSSVSETNESQGDSEINFISGYIIEVEDDANVNVSNEPSVEQQNIKPYEGEPIADAEWISNYNKEIRMEEERLEVLVRRLDVRVTVESWCKCGNCKIDLLQNPKECQCCQEIDGCMDALNSDIVIQEVETVPGGITLHPGFNSVCLDMWSLRLAGRKYRKIDRKKYEIRDNENRYLRSVAYREYIQLVYGYLGRKRIPLPACAYNTIRMKFGDEKDFIGYDENME